MKVLFLSPHYPPEMRAFTRGLAEVGADVIGVGDTPAGQLDPVVKRSLSDYLQVPSALDAADVTARLEAWAPARTVDRVETNWEPMIQLAAALRARWDLPGMRPEVVEGFRDKGAMRERLRAAGVRVPRASRATTAAQARAAAERIGFPLIVKPIAGAGSADTWRADGAEDLERVLRRTAHVPEISVEEWVEGVEHTHETICVNGRPLIEGCTRYYPNALDARQHAWISPIILTLRDLDAHELRDGMAMGRRALEVLGMGTGFTHMEWFRTASGEAVFGEIACRSPGANMVDLMNYAADVDLYREWARAVCFEQVEAPNTQAYHAAIVFKRASGEGRIRAIEGLDAFLAEHRPHVARVDLLPIGAPRRDWRQTFLSDGNLVVRHPDRERTLAMAREAAERIHLYAG